MPPRSSNSNVGFECPKCKIDRTRVKDSRQNEDGHVRRRRECPTCGFKFSTVEVFEGATLSIYEQEQLNIFRRMLPQLYRLADQIDLLRAEHD